MEKIKDVTENDFFNKKITEVVDIPEMKTKIKVKVMSGFERRMFQQKMANDTKNKDDVPDHMFSTLIAMTAITYNTEELIFNIEKIKEIDNIPITIQEKIFTISANLNGLTTASREEYIKN